MNRIDGVARELDTALTGCGRPNSFTKALARVAFRAVLDAIAEPSEDLICIGDEEIVKVLNAQSFLKALDEGTPALRCYRAMIAALRHELDDDEAPAIGVCQIEGDAG